MLKSGVVRFISSDPHVWRRVYLRGTPVGRRVTVVTPPSSSTCSSRANRAGLPSGGSEDARLGGPAQRATLSAFSKGGFQLAERARLNSARRHGLRELRCVADHMPRARPAKERPVPEEEHGSLYGRERGSG